MELLTAFSLAALLTSVKGYINNGLSTLDLLWDCTQGTLTLQERVTVGGKWTISSSSSDEITYLIIIYVTHHNIVRK